MQFLRQQRNGRKRKTYLEKIGLADDIQSVEQFYAAYKLTDKICDSGQGSVYGVAHTACGHANLSPMSSDEDKQEFEIEGNETKDIDNTRFVVKIISFSDVDEVTTELRTYCKRYQLLHKIRLTTHTELYYDEHERQLYIVTERLCSTLANATSVSCAMLHEQHLKRICCDILHSLSMLHDAAGYAHCDVNPFNIMSDCHGHYRLIDYDMMLAIDDKCGYTEECWHGTVGWVAPEITANGKSKYTFAGDLWSLGLCLLYMLNGGRNPFDLTPAEMEEHELNDEHSKLEFYCQHKMKRAVYKNVKCLLVQWFMVDKISFSLYDLLLQHLLVFDVSKRCQTCTQLIQHPWISSFLRQNKHKYPNFKVQLEEEPGEMLQY
eukprot:CAMPEP_0202694848 /NCGR_PEP_ID=MMETSP1385-20130828/8593_1 /ASSEMBLY_ACC=CAM_ASM_000861 /TAXON_ID=933848 /ORGANISM="Elphidium margaritaceum" /LENGTH=376 /DNA_ID=CAMNT_0049350761 /DNA_START=60 /DNA_END=1190 /DNA_ORIENTATION=+